MSLATALANLDAKRDELVANLITMGVSASDSETLATLIPKVLTIQSGYELGWNVVDIPNDFITLTDIDKPV